MASRVANLSGSAIVPAALLAIACVRPPAREVVRVPAQETRQANGRVDVGGPMVRVAIATAAPRGRLTASGSWRLHDHAGRGVLARGSGGDEWMVEHRRGRIRAVRGDGVPTAWRAEPLILRPLAAGALVEWDGKRYRGELTITARDSGLLVVNRLPLEEYLRGVVPLEIGPRTSAERAAVEAQAVAARSYTMVRLGGGRTRPYDLLSTVSDQVYGGAGAETAVGDEAVRRTAGLVITFAGRVVNAPYSAVCGGSTAEVSESWIRQPDQPYLKRVSDRIPGTERYYCDASPKFSWVRTFTGDELSTVLDRYLGRYAPLRGRAGVPRMIAIDGRSPSGRVSSFVVTTDRGRYVLRGDDIRWVMRTPGGEILNSSYFSIESLIERGGRIGSLTLRGNGNGHGIGMCQWGAIGRARAGQDFREILRTYYPGTSVAPVD